GSKRLSGQLSEPRAIKPPLRFIGPLSLFSGISVKGYQSETVELLLLLSGPEPQRSILEKILLERFGHSGSGTILIRGSCTKFQAGDYSIRIHDFLDEKELAPYLSNAKTVICRSGYSTLMDLHASGETKIILIPTPGQPEQEYLARYWSEHFGSGFCYQNEAKTCRFQAV
ncbi:MAG TPA: glycosyltransferase, partial [Bacteroidia bacterium]|nr:glycosyltransferase [Bacteroidia bacterium]